MILHNALLTFIFVLSLFFDEILSQEKPKIQVDQQPGLEFWTFLTPANDSVTSGLDSQLTLKCSAPYPIKFRIEGHQGENFFRVVEGKTTSNQKGELTYIIQMGNVFSKPASVKVICVHYKNPSISSLLSVFVSDPGGVSDFVPVVTTSKLPTGKVIECPTSNPRAVVQLYREVVSNGGQVTLIQITGATYDHTLGFIFNTVQKGRFVCQTSNRDLVRVNLQSPFRKTGTNTAVQTQMWLTSDTVYLICNTTSGEIATHVLKQGDDAKKFIPPGGNNKLNKVVVLNGAKQANSSFVCRANSEISTNILEYHFVESPRLIFNTRSAEWDCVSAAGNKSISSIRCINQNDCFLFKECFDSAKCRRSDQDFFAGEAEDGNCWYTESNGEVSTVGKPCISIRSTFESGFIECGVANREKTVNFPFFTGLKRVKYQSWKEAPRDELIRLDEVNSILYANSTNYFFCEAVGFIFVDTIHYFLSFINGSTIFLTPDKYINDKTLRTSRRKVQDFNIISGININLPLEANELICQAALMDEPVKLNASRKFAVKYLSAPLIDRSATKVKLTRGYNDRLVCKSEGQPPPQIRWYFKNELIEHIKTTTNGEGIYEIPKVDDSHGGEYFCTAHNRVANDTVTFNVTVAEPVETTLYLVILATVIVICALFVIAFYFWRQHKFAKELLRQLTDEEIDEFLNGNKDMWILNLNSNKQENINYMPYNKDYEIPIHSLDLGDDETSLLGSGEYGMIVKAKYDSSTVAVKTTKPAADVLYFKALLTELKVMIFIGEQENIVKLIGAVTENIKDRKLYIVFELCTLGNLEGYLRDNKASYVDENADQGVANDQSSSGYMNKVITSNELTRWSYEVACAMEWLALKKVVHADLATRNVLLTETRTAKLSDFGLSMKLYQDNNYVKRKQVPLPFRWMAIEGLKQLQFSTETDIWSYGVTVWEIFTLGDVPFPGKQWDNDFVDKLSKGLRLERPIRCPANLYKDILLKCWEVNPSDRPSFTVLKNHFRKMTYPNDNSEERIKSKLGLGTVMNSGIENANYSEVYEDTTPTPKYSVMEEEN